MVPLILFAYNRPDTLSKTIAAVLQQTVKPDKIIAVIDGPNSPLGERCMQLLTAVADEILFRPTNLGCAGSIMFGINDAMHRFERFTVLEDDTLPAKHWYGSMCALLEHYETNERVGAVGSYPSILNNSLDNYNYDVILSPRFSCWGWGSWRSKWSKVHEEWLYYRNNGHPPWNPSELPTHGGSDIANMIINHRAGQLWDGVVAGSFLHHGWLQAITKYYLVHNIGAFGVVPASKLQFMFNNNPIQERIPQSFPEMSDLRSDVSVAVCDYVAAMTS